MQGRSHQFAAIQDRFDELREKVDEQTDDLADLVETCERELRSLQRDFYSFELQVDNCICDNPTECTEYSCTPLHELDYSLVNLKERIWDIYIREMEEIGDRQLIMREVTKVVQDLPARKTTRESHLNESIECVICGDDENDECVSCGHNDYCNFSCNEDVLFHRNCLKTNFEVMANIIYEAGELKSEIIAQQIIYSEADRDNQDNDFAFQVYMFVRLLESLYKGFQFNFFRQLYIENCNCGNQNPQCEMNCGPVGRVNHVFLEIINLIRECLSDDMKERLERQMVRKIIQVVEGLPALKITDNHIDENVECGICLVDYNVGEEPCYLPCNGVHIFHRNCIEDWLKRQNSCPLCRRPAYLPKHSVYHAPMERLGMVESWL